MKRLLKKASNFTYKATSQLYPKDDFYSDYEEGTIEYDLDDKDLDCLNTTLKEEIDENGPKGLAEYLKDPLKQFVDNISLSATKETLTATISCNKELTDDEKEQLKNYLSGQYTDGFGEGFEQRPINEFTTEEEYEEEDDDDEDYVQRRRNTIMETCKHEIYVSFYKNGRPNITLS